MPKKTLFSGVLRTVSGPERSELIALPESRHEVESIASDLPKPDTVLLGSSATETQFKHLPLSQYNVLHLALHGYADMEYSERSALVVVLVDRHTASAVEMTVAFVRENKLAMIVGEPPSAVGAKAIHDDNAWDTRTD
jgi:CHAT domain-containing protein